MQHSMFCQRQIDLPLPPADINHETIGVVLLRRYLGVQQRMDNTYGCGVAEDGIDGNPGHRTGKRNCWARLQQWKGFLRTR